jgi:hypothetical protein
MGLYTFGAYASKKCDLEFFKASLLLIHVHLCQPNLFPYCTVCRQCLFHCMISQVFERMLSCICAALYVASCWLGNDHSRHIEVMHSIRWAVYCTWSKTLPSICYNVCLEHQHWSVIVTWYVYPGDTSFWTQTNYWLSYMRFLVVLLSASRQCWDHVCQ